MRHTKRLGMHPAVWRRRAWLTLVAVALPLLVISPGSAGGPLDPLSYRILTVYGSSPAKSSPGVLLVPAPVDVDDNGLPDVLVQLQIDAARATLRVTKLPDAPDPLPLSVEAVLADPRQGSPYRVAFGYDALSSTAPSLYTGTIFLAGAGRAASFSLDVETVLPGSTLGITAAIFDEGPNGERNDPARGRVDFTPVPTVAHFGGLVGSDLGVSQSSIDITSNLPTKAVVVLESIDGPKTLRADATIDQVPNAVSLVLNDSPTGTRTWDYTASGRVGLIDLRIANTAALALIDEFVLHVEDMALNATLVQDTPTHSTFQADSGIGVVELGLATGGAIKWLDEDNAYLFQDDAGGVDSVAVRVLGLSAFEISTADPFLLDATLEAGPLHIAVNQGASTLQGWVRDLPSHFRISFSPAAGTITYAGSATIGELTVDAVDPDGISGRATEVHLLMRDIPTALDLAFGEGASSVTLDAKGATLGLIEVQLTSGPDERIDAGKDGLLLRDLGDRYVLFGRVTGLRKVTVDQGPPPALQLATAGGREFVVDFAVEKPTGTATTNAVIHVLPQSMAVSFTGPTTFTYTGSETVELITLDAVDPAGISGRATELHARFEALPHAFDVGFANDGTVTLDAKGEKIGLIEFLLTSGPDDRALIGAANDGILLEDLFEKYVLFVRVHDLYNASAKAPSMSIDSDGGRVFKIEIDQLKTGGKVEYLRITLDHLVRHIRVSMTDAGGKSVTTYDADEITNSLSMDSNSGDRWNIHTGIAPLPVHLDFCNANSGACANRPAGDTRPGGQSPSSSNAIHASEHVTVNIFDCQRPLSASCTPGGATKYFQVTNWRVRFFEQENGGTDSSGYIWENTTSHDTTRGCAAGPQSSDAGACHFRVLGGSIKARDESAGTGIEQTFGNGNFWADQRQGGWCIYIFSCNKKNFINCDGASLSVWLLNIKIGVSGFLC